jgi:hypothetical protein
MVLLLCLIWQFQSPFAARVGGEESYKFKASLEIIRTIFRIGRFEHM